MREADAAKTAWSCRVCLSAEVNITIVPCGHVLCLRCSAAVSRCPFCRTQVSRTMKIFRPWNVIEVHLRMILRCLRHTMFEAWKPRTKCFIPINKATCLSDSFYLEEGLTMFTRAWFVACIAGRKHVLNGNTTSGRLEKNICSHGTKTFSCPVISLFSRNISLYMTG